MKTIVLVEGFSSTRGEEKFKRLSEEIRKKFCGARILIPEYFEKYGKLGKYFRKKTIAEYAEIVFQKIEPFIGDGEPLILIGYSLGGIICHRLVEEMGVLAKIVILVGTPIRGINFYWWEKLFLKIARIPCLNIKPFCGSTMRRNYYFIGGRWDKRVSLESAIPWFVEYSRRIYIVDASHSKLMSGDKAGIESSAIPKILKILSEWT